MCGFVGFIELKKQSSKQKLQEEIKRMTDTLFSRGPDDSGFWIDGKDNIALGHRRLSILDLSLAGHQPMISQNERYIIIYNGEIYNFREIRKQLEGCSNAFQGDSDTEVVLAGCVEWGIENLAQRLSGMFAFALWDKEEKTLYLARDRVGIKPLYWSLNDDLFLFGSQLKSLVAHKGWAPKIDRHSLTEHLRYKFIPAPLTIYNNVQQLLPGHILIWKKGAAPKTKCYWDIDKVALNGIENKFKLEEKELSKQLDDLLHDSVRSHMISDVPLGVFLSGGVDSSLITAIMQSESSQKTKSFSIGFHEAEYNEAQNAKAVANHLKTEHTEFYVKSNDVVNLIPEISQWFDEPFADVSQLPTLLLSKLTREHVTVALSGDGGDELFGGYNRYIWANKVSTFAKHTPDSLRNIIAASLGKVSPAAWQKLSHIIPEKIRPRLLAEKMPKLLNFLSLKKQNELYPSIMGGWLNANEAVLNHNNDLMINEVVRGLNIVEQLQLWDMKMYLPSDILVKTDRASMAFSLETRVPYLDHSLIEFAWRLPLNMKIKGGSGKYLLRQLLYQYVPQEIVDRPKAGFAVPIGEWLRGSLKDWAEDLLDQKKLQEQGFFNSEIIRSTWQEHISGKKDWQHQLWTVLMFQEWLNKT